MTKTDNEVVNRLDEQRAALVSALASIWRNGADTLSGRADGPDDRDWQRAAVQEMTKRAREALPFDPRSEDARDAMHAALTAPPLRAKGEAPLTATQLADALGCFWNAALGAEVCSYDATARATAGAIASGFAAVETRLHELAATPTQPRREVTDAELLGAIGRGWCSPGNADKECDVNLAVAILAEIRKLESFANGGDGNGR